METIAQQSETEAIKQDKYLFLYGIVNNEDIKLDMGGLKGKPIIRIKFKDISALMSFYPTFYPVLRDEEAMQHSEILKKIAEKTTIIPMSFGTVIKNEKILKNILAKSYLTLKQTLKLIDGKIELGVKVIKKQQNGEYNKEKVEILESLKGLSVKSIAGDKFSDLLLLNHSFLVEKDKFSAFSEEVAELENKFQDLKFLYTGPWPPYSFVSIKVGGS